MSDCLVKAARTACLVACCTLIVGFYPDFARAQDPALQERPPEGPQAQTIPEEVAADNGEPRGLTMMAMDALGLGDDLDSAGINLGGLVEVGYTHSFGDPVDDEIVGRAFDFEDDELILNQLDFVAERETDYEKPWDVGFKLEMLYGRDGRFTRSNGFLDDDDDEEPNTHEFDITQLYGEIILPVGNGMKLTAGKFITPLGYELVMPADNAFYSHSFIFNLVPYAHTGLLLTYPLCDQWTIAGGASRGWDQAGEDNNDAIDGIGVVTFAPSDETEMALSFTIGPELEDNTDDWRYAFDYYITHQCTENLLAAIDATWIYEENAGEDGEDANTFGIAGYATYTINDRFDVNARAEWFGDTDGYLGYDANLYEVTLGLKITPFAGDPIGRNLFFRPEVRYDVSDEDVFDDGENDQITFGIDAIVLF